MYVQHITFYNNVLGDTSYDFSIHLCVKSLTYSSQVIVQLASGLVRQETDLILSLSYKADERKGQRETIEDCASHCLEGAIADTHNVLRTISHFFVYSGPLFNNRQTFNPFQLRAVPCVLI